MTESFQEPKTRYFDEIEGAEDFQSQSLQVSLTSGTAQVAVRVPWEDRFSAILEILEGGSNGKPKMYPFDQNIRGGASGSPWVAQSVQIAPVPTTYKKDGQAIEYYVALITITYVQMTTEFSFDPTGTFMTINPNGLFWGLNGGSLSIAPEEAPGIFLASHDLTLSHPHMQVAGTYEGNTWNVEDFEGTCNAADISFCCNGYSRTYPAETLLCSSPSMKCGCNLSGRGFFAVSLRLSYNPLGHNCWFHPRQELPDGAVDCVQNRKVSMYRGEACTEELRYKPIHPVDFTPLFAGFGVLGS